MPLKPLVTTGIESLLSTFLYRSPTLKTTRLRLLGKMLRVEVKNFSTSLAPVFSERQVDVLGGQAGDVGCTVIAYVSVLPKLRDRQQLVVLIRSGGLEVQGDIQVVQNFVALADLAGLDPAKLLTSYIGDVVAEGISKALYGGAKFLHHGIKHQRYYVAEATTEEWCMTPGPLEVAWPAEEMTAVKRAADALTKRLEKLETK